MRYYYIVRTLNICLLYAKSYVLEGKITIKRQNFEELLSILFVKTKQNKTNKPYEEMLYVSWFTRVGCVIKDHHKMAVLFRRLAAIALENPFFSLVSLYFIIWSYCECLFYT